MRTDATRVCRNAVAVAVAAPRRLVRRSGSRRQPGHGRPRQQTGIVLTAVGLVVTLAVHVRSAPVDPKVAGLILIGAGLAWLWVPVRHKRAVLLRQFQHAIRYLSWDDGQPADRCPLTELLAAAPPCNRTPRGRGGDGQRPMADVAAAAGRAAGAVPAPLSRPRTDPG